MNFKNLSRSLVCLLLVACMLVAVSPIRAKAVDPLTVGLMGISAAAVLGYALIGLGIQPGFNMDSFNLLIEDCKSYLEDMGEWIHDGMIDLVTVSSGEMQNYFVNRRLLNTIKQWLYDTGILGTKLTSTAGKLQGIGITLNAFYALAHEWGAALPLASLALSAPLGSFLLVDTLNNQGGTSMGGFRVQPSAYVGHNVISYVSASSTLSLAPYTSENFPVGQFLTDFGFNDSISTSKIFLSKIGALAYYDYAVANGLDGTAYWLTNESYYDLGEYSSTYQYTYLRNLGGISAGGLISESGNSKQLYKNYYIARGILPAGYASQDVLNVVTDFDLTLGNVGLPDQTLQDGYKDWHSGAITVGAQLGLMDDELFYPINYNDKTQIQDLTQQQVQLGNTIAESLIQSDMVTQKGLKGLLDAMLTSITGWFQRLALNTSNMLDAIKNGFSQLGAALSSLPTLVAGFFRTLASHFKSVFLLGSLLGVLGEYLQALFSWLPENMLAVLMLLFGVSIFYKFIGR